MVRRALEIETPYREALSGILSFSNFEEAEKSILRLDHLRREYQSRNDGKGVEYCRRIGLLGRRRAEYISRNRRVCERKRLQKREIASWFQIWLENPAIFEDWLSLRKGAGEFKELLQS